MYGAVNCGTVSGWRTAWTMVRLRYGVIMYASPDNSTDWFAGVSKPASCNHSHRAIESRLDTSRYEERSMVWTVAFGAKSERV